MSTAPAARLFSASEQHSIRTQMERIFESPAFRSSPRCQQLLRYLTENALDGRTDMLRERVIGTEVFERAPAYDTGEDSIVRVRANDLRKRLAQYYDGAPDREHELRIHLPAGSYLPEFVFRTEPETIPPATADTHATVVSKQVRWRSRMLIIGMVLLITTVIAIQRFPHAATVIDDFWAPVVSSTKPILFCLGDAQVFGLSKDLQQRFFRTHPRSGEPEPAAVELAPDDVLHGADLVSVQGQFVGVGGAQSVQMLSNLLAFRGKVSMLRTSADLSFADLKQYPTVLIGAFSNRWTLRLSRQLRFFFEESTGTRICDRQRPGVAWEVERDHNGRELVDYSVISRLVHSETGQVIIGASGITQYGCTAAGELISNVAYLEQALREAPSDWRKKNIQIVLRSKVVGKTPGPPEVVATYFW